MSLVKRNNVQVLRTIECNKHRIRTTQGQLEYFYEKLWECNSLEILNNKKPMTGAGHNKPTFYLRYFDAIRTP